MEALIAAIILAMCVDTLATYALWPRAFRVGLLLMRVKTSLPEPVVPDGTRFSTKRGVFKKVEADTVLFRPRHRLFSWVQPTSANCSISWDTGDATVTARFSAGGVIALVLVALWLIALGFEESVVDVLFLLPALGLGWAFNVYIIRRWVRGVLTEYVEHTVSARA